MKQGNAILEIGIKRETSRNLGGGGELIFSFNACLKVSLLKSVGGSKCLDLQPSFYSQVPPDFLISSLIYNFRSSNLSISHYVVRHQVSRGTLGHLWSKCE